MNFFLNVTLHFIGIVLNNTLEMTATNIGSIKQLQHHFHTVAIIYQIELPLKGFVL